jgi:tetratricopeptide (TPR) repeat protein
LRRRVVNDPASLAFAQLAEELRRSGELDEAVRIARAGLERHPGYLSARATLGQALLQLGRLDEAEAELQQVLHVAPDNLLAVRGMTELRDQRAAADPASAGALRELKGWLAAIMAERAARA